MTYFGPLTGRVAAQIISNKLLKPSWESTPEQGEDSVPVDEQKEDKA